jgi:hypothetical protein
MNPVARLPAARGIQQIVNSRNLPERLIYMRKRVTFGKQMGFGKRWKQLLEIHAERCLTRMKIEP